MDSGSRKNRIENQTKEPPGDDVPRPREETAAAAAAAPEPPPPAPPSESLQERTNGLPEAGGGRNPSAPAAVAAEAAAPSPRDGTAVGKPPLPPRAAPSRRGSESVKPPLPPLAASVSRAGEPKPAGGKPPLPRRAVPASTSKSEGKKPMSHAEVVESSMAVRVKCKQMREGRREIEEAFNALLEESKKAMPEQGTATQQEEQVSQWREMREGRREMEEELNELLGESKKAMPEQGTATQQKEQVSQWREMREGRWEMEEEFNKLLEESKKAMPEQGTATQQKEQCRILRRRNMLIIIVGVLAIGYLPTRGEAFQKFDTVEGAANGLAMLNNLNDVHLQLRKEAPAVGFSLGLWFPLILGACLMGGLATWFVDPAQEPGLPVEGEPQLPEIHVTTILLLFVALLAMVVVTVRCLGGGGRWSSSV